MTTTPPIAGPIQYGVQWKLSKGYPVSQGNKLQRNEDGFPIVEPTDDGEETEISYLHTDYEWKSVELEFNAVTDRAVKPLINYTIKAKVFEYRISTSKPDDTQEEKETVEFIRFLEDVDITSKITSHDPNSGNTWVYPDDFDVVEPSTYPTQYGGVVLFDGGSVSGIDDGPNDDGIIQYNTSNGTLEVTSGYNYIDVFDRADFGYIPWNSFKEVKIARGDTFRFQPVYEDLKDPYGLAAPIYPMNTITAFVPDDRDAVTVKYTVKIEARDKDGKSIDLENPEVTVNQTCTQDVSDYSNQVEQLLQYCNWSNPQNIPYDKFSDSYPNDYPYTLVNRFEGLQIGVTPDTRGEDTDYATLQRGDVWYDPDSDTRYYWSIADVPEDMDIVNPGTNYRDNDDVVCVWQPETSCNILENRSVPFGLLVNIKTKGGKIQSVSISADAVPQNFVDGDIVHVQGGDNNAKLRINITKPSRWVQTFISKYNGITGS